MPHHFLPINYNIERIVVTSGSSPLPPFTPFFFKKSYYSFELNDLIRFH